MPPTDRQSTVSRRESPAERTSKQLIHQSITLDPRPVRDIRVRTEACSLGGGCGYGLLLVVQDVAKV